MTQPLSHGSAFTGFRHDTRLEDSIDFLIPYRIYAGHRSILGVIFIEWDVLGEVEKSTCRNLESGLCTLGCQGYHPGLYVTSTTTMLFQVEKDKTNGILEIRCSTYTVESL
jgi:hypothetical protein